jgi:hypothetical protein
LVVFTLSVVKLGDPGPDVPPCVEKLSQDAFATAGIDHCKLADPALKIAAVCGLGRFPPCAAPKNKVDGATINRGCAVKTTTLTWTVRVVDPEVIRISP